MTESPSIRPKSQSRRRAKPGGDGRGSVGGNEGSAPAQRVVQIENGISGPLALSAGSSGPLPIVVNLVLPPIPAGCRAKVRLTEGGLDVTIEHARVGYTIEEACEIIPNAPHPDTLRAHLEKNGIAIGQCGRAPLISFEQLFAALRLSA